MDTENKRCELCHNPGGTVLWASPSCRVVRIADADYPGLCRVIWTAHQREMSDLEAVQQQHLMAVVFAVERVVRQLFSPDKMNLASFGNLTPHLHWHVIPRWQDDRHFPEPIWGQPHNANPPLRSDISDQTLIQALKQQLPSGAIHA